MIPNLFGFDPAILAKAGKAATQKGVMGKVADFVKNNNKVLSQMLMAAGADASAGTGTANLANAVMQNIASGNFTKMLEKVFNAPVDKVQISKDGTKISLAAPQQQTQAQTQIQPQAQTQAQLPNTWQQALSNFTGASGETLGSEGGIVPQTPVQTPITPSTNPFSQSQGASSNPFVQALSSISRNDLAGLTPEMISGILNYKLALDQAESENAFKFGVMAPYYQAQMSQMAAAAETDRLNAIAKIEDALATAPIELRGAGKLTLKQWEKLPDDVRSYAYATYLDPNTPDFTTWKNQTKPGETERLLERAMSDQEFKNILMEYRRSGATNISLGEKLEEKHALNQLESSAYFDTKDWAAQIDKISETDDAVFNLRKQLISSGMDPTEAKNKALLATKLAAVETEILSRNGKIVKKYKSGNTYSWEVEFPAITNSDGKVLMPQRRRTIQYVVK